jgi:RNA polymerase sigma factor (sigma-70 family)
MQSFSSNIAHAATRSLPSPDGTFPPTRPVMLGEMRSMGGAWGGMTSSPSIGARWRTLVRAAVRLGCARHDAADVVQTALARCDVAWSKVSRADNRDAYVYRTLVNALRDNQRRHWWRERPARSLPDVTRPDDTTRVALADAVERALDELTAEQRAVVVLRYIGHRPNVRQPPHSASPSEPSRAGGRARWPCCLTTSIRRTTRPGARHERA